MDNELLNDIERVAFTEEQIRDGVARAAKWLDERLLGRYPLAVCVLKGSVMFYCDLIRAMNTSVQLDFMTVSSYGSGSKSSGNIRLVTDLSTSVEGRDVIIVEDIIDSGNTFLSLREILKARGARSVTLVSLFDKPSRREVDITPDFACFTVGNDFIVGYGLDYAQRYRDMRFVGVLKREIYDNKD